MINFLKLTSSNQYLQYNNIYRYVNYYDFRDTNQNYNENYSRCSNNLPYANLPLNC